MTFDRTASEHAQSWAPQDPSARGVSNGGAYDPAADGYSAPGGYAPQESFASAEEYTAQDQYSTPSQSWEQGQAVTPGAEPPYSADASAAPGATAIAPPRERPADSPWRRFLDHDGTPEGRARRPEFRHGTVLPEAWFAIVFNPAKWRAGGWALFGALLTMAADLIAFFYISNILGVGAKVEMEMWLLIAGITGFVTITGALWAIWKNARRGAGIWALVLGLVFGAFPAWLVGNTIIQFIANGGSLPVAPPLW